ncbi:DUF4286 family protein [Robertkochia marina]|uniref:DUF4286 family protein n=1 Tax=Robertkochia marina TaxID=1227945 RepID=A0A4S3M3G1_9FLAO|nr:DUF4286 family protein [Robertkochia marina]THD69636.1 DUF4286 family protein [Robertkochia marina]TRZ47019.1 DUF4286 family protein [Robertkochia marina]
MIIYNVTINVEEAVKEEWVQWMREQHIPDMIGTGKFTGARMVRVLVEEEMGGVTYSVQYYTRDKNTLERYYREDAERLRADALRKFPNKFVAFRTELEVISEH